MSHVEPLHSDTDSESEQDYAHSYHVFWEDNPLLKQCRIQPTAASIALPNPSETTADTIATAIATPQKFDRTKRDTREAALPSPSSVALSESVASGARPSRLSKKRRQPRSASMGEVGSSSTVGVSAQHGVDAGTMRLVSQLAQRLSQKQQQTPTSVLKDKTSNSRNVNTADRSHSSSFLSRKSEGKRAVEAGVPPPTPTTRSRSAAAAQMLYPSKSTAEKNSGDSMAGSTTAAAPTLLGFSTTKPSAVSGRERARNSVDGGKSSVVSGPTSVSAAGAAVATRTATKAVRHDDEESDSYFDDGVDDTLFELALSQLDEKAIVEASLSQEKSKAALAPVLIPSAQEKAHDITHGRSGMRNTGAPITITKTEEAKRQPFKPERKPPTNLQSPGKKTVVPAPGRTAATKPSVSHAPPLHRRESLICSGTAELSQAERERLEAAAAVTLQGLEGCSWSDDDDDF